MNIIILLIIILVIFIINNFSVNEYFGYPVHQAFNSWIPVYGGYTNFPWWNSRIGMTRNMSYDLRGDPLIINSAPISPWNNSSIYPIYNNVLI